ncbi:MAG: hypothetical protein AAF282_19800, partial [Cyanobacteria bacterium P01_A01_bin.15]
ALAFAQQASVFRRETSAQVTHPFPGAEVTTTVEYLEDVMNGDLDPFIEALLQQENQIAQAADV